MPREDGYYSGGHNSPLLKQPRPQKRQFPCAHCLAEADDEHAGAVASSAFAGADASLIRRSLKRSSKGSGLGRLHSDSRPCPRCQDFASLMKLRREAPSEGPATGTHGGFIVARQAPSARRGGCTSCLGLSLRLTKIHTDIQKSRGACPR